MTPAALVPLYNGWKKCHELGKVRLEGRDYVMRESDIVEFKVGC